MNQAETLCSLRHLIIDMDGVLYRGDTIIPGTSELIAFLRAQEIDFVLATNNATRTPQQFVDKLAGMGVTVYTHEVLTSSLATAGYLAGIAPPGTCVFVVGMDFTVCYQQLAQASLQIRAGAQFIGTNPDLTFPSERGIMPGAGSLLAFLTAATTVTPTVIGKPGTAMMQQAMARMEANPATTAMLGDRLETDILAGKRAGLYTLLVLSGVTDRALLADSEIQPDLVFEDVAELHDVWAWALGTGNRGFKAGALRTEIR